MVSDNLVITFEIDLTPEESALLSQAAAAENLPAHRFMKNVAVAAARARLAEAVVGSVNQQRRARRSG